MSEIKLMQIDQIYQSTLNKNTIIFAVHEIFMNYSVFLVCDSKDLFAI